jgi:hypothetical protein
MSLPPMKKSSMLRGRKKWKQKSRKRSKAFLGKTALETPGERFCVAILGLPPLKSKLLDSI